ncbi:MAG: T9SS type A sorting domain-containing protein [Melioribacteraceae bacterium]|nr:T9SS type A sorting domain-containing protein [Melioribacteraceae bacterium]
MKYVILFLFLFVQYNYAQTYCSASVREEDEYISRVVAGSIDNTTGSDNGSPYDGYSDHTSISTTHERGESFSIEITLGAAYSDDKGAVWIDWNDDGDFDDANESISLSVKTGMGPYSGTITVPDDAELGDLRMRVRMQYYNYPPVCGATNYGEIEDYTIHVNEHTTNFNDGTSTVATGLGVEPVSISCSDNTEGERKQVLDFALSDQGSGDGLATIIDQIVITKGTNNDVSDWSLAIGGAQLAGPDLSTELSGTVEEDRIIFFDDNFISIADNATETYQLKIWMADKVYANSGDDFDFKLDYAEITTSLNGSYFGSGSVESGAISIVFDEPPGAATPFAPIDEQTEVLTNTDLHWNAAAEVPTGYKLYFGTDEAASNIVNGAVLGNVTTFDPGILLPNETYYWKIVPFNANGNATGTEIWNFSTVSQGYIYQNDFNSDNGSPTVSSGEWDWETPTLGPSQAFSPPKCWGVDIDGKYENSTTSSLTFAVDLSSISASSPLRLKWIEWIDNVGGDYAYVRISSTEHSTAKTIYSYDGRTGGDYEKNWHKIVKDISLYAGDNNVTITFEFVPDASFVASGWYIDNLGIYYYSDGTPAAWDQPTPGGTGAQTITSTTAAVVYFSNVTTAGEMDFKRYDSQPSSDANPEIKGSSATSNDNSDITVDIISDKFWTILPGETEFDGSYDLTLPTAGIDGISDINKLVIIKRENELSPWAPHNTTVVETNKLKVTGLTTMSDFAIGANSSENPLPVELETFNATLLDDEKVQLNWQTVTEVDNYGFEIQRQTKNEKRETADDNLNWDVIAFAEGHGNSNSPKEYSFTDKPMGGGRFNYRLKQIDTDGTFTYSEIVEIEIGLPTKFELFQNYPNPFNPTATIKYSIPRGKEYYSQQNRYAQQTSLKVFDVLGREIATLVNKEQRAGNYEVRFDASGLSSGIYFYKLTSGGYNKTMKMLLLK